MIPLPPKGKPKNRLQILLSSKKKAALKDPRTQLQVESQIPVKLKNSDPRRSLRKEDSSSRRKERVRDRSNEGYRGSNERRQKEKKRLKRRSRSRSRSKSKERRRRRQRQRSPSSSISGSSRSYSSSKDSDSSRERSPSFSRKDRGRPREYMNSGFRGGNLHGRTDATIYAANLIKNPYSQEGKRRLANTKYSVLPVVHSEYGLKIDQMIKETRSLISNVVPLTKYDSENNLENFMITLAMMDDFPERDLPSTRSLFAKPSISKEKLLNYFCSNLSERAYESKPFNVKHRQEAPLMQDMTETLGVPNPIYLFEDSDHHKRASEIVRIPAKSSLQSTSTK